MVTEIWSKPILLSMQINLNTEEMTAIFISLAIAIALSFVYDHWATVFIVAFASFTLMFLSIVPCIGISDTTQNILISGGASVFLAGIRYHFIKTTMPELFRDKSFGTVLVIMGIIVLLLLIFF